MLLKAYELNEACHCSLKLWSDTCIIPFTITQCDTKGLFRLGFSFDKELDLDALLTPSSLKFVSKD